MLSALVSLCISNFQTGIGIETARVLAQHGATVIIGRYPPNDKQLTFCSGCRDPTKAEAAVNTIRATNPSGTIEAARLDLGSLASVREFGREFKTKHNTLNILINNAYV